ncbi:Arc family DNA-binding protein [Massilia sp. S19_KUP03_FR1]|uniref:Arc family DNA-binding protein n=1 Tax=Massilia sp. S19_KUP03_FR1 TaxID=3025503 RepID=UPI002FCD66AB
MTRSIAPFGIRMPEELKKQLTEQARNNHRSLNSELVMRLEESLKKELKSNE